VSDAETGEAWGERALVTMCTRYHRPGLAVRIHQQHARPRSQVPRGSRTALRPGLGSVCLRMLSESWVCLLHLLKIIEEKRSGVTLNHSDFNRFILFDPVSLRDSVFGHLSTARI